jgi:arsenite methyltransferase
MEPKTIYKQISQRYSAASQGTGAGYSKTVAKSFGYIDEDLASTLQDANLGLGCGNPLALASLREVLKLPAHWGAVRQIICKLFTD